MYFLLLLLGFILFLVGWQVFKTVSSIPWTEENIEIWNCPDRVGKVFVLHFQSRVIVSLTPIEITIIDIKKIFAREIEQNTLNFAQSNYNIYEAGFYRIGGLTQLSPFTPDGPTRIPSDLQKALIQKFKMLNLQDESIATEPKVTISN